MCLCLIYVGPHVMALKWLSGKICGVSSFLSPTLQWVPGIKLRWSGLHSKCLYWWATPPALRCFFFFFLMKAKRTSIKSQKYYCRGRFLLHGSQTWPAGSYSLCGQDHSDRLIRISWYLDCKEEALTDQIQDAVSNNCGRRVHSSQGSCQGTLPGLLKEKMIWNIITGIPGCAQNSQRGRNSTIMNRASSLWNDGAERRNWKPHRTSIYGPGEMVRCSFCISKILSSIPSTNISNGLQATWNSSSSGPNILFWPPWATIHMMYIHALLILKQH